MAHPARNPDPPPALNPTLVFDRAASRAVDGDALSNYGVPGIVLMENAARGLTDHVLTCIDQTGATRAAVVVGIVCGRGNNGGDGYAAARHLANAGVRPVLVTTGPPREGSDAATNAEICRRMGLAHLDAAKVHELGDDVVLLVDALFGTGLDRPLEGEMASLVQWMNAHGAPVVAVDVPSGLDADTGAPLGDAVVRASSTVTFVGRKQGFLASGAATYTGEVVVVDIGAPAACSLRHGRVTE